MKSGFFTVISIVLLFASCSPTAKIVNSWRDPSTTVDSRALHKVAIFAPVENEGRRRTTEDKLVEAMKGKGVALYKLIPDVSTVDENMVKQKLSDNGFDAALVMRLVTVSKELEYIPGNYNTYPQYFGNYWGYYYNSWTTFSQPGYYTENQNYLVETNLYSLKNDKLIWSGITSSINPSNLDSMLNDIVWAVYHQMVEEGFLVKEKK